MIQYVECFDFKFEMILFTKYFYFCFIYSLIHNVKEVVILEKIKLKIFIIHVHKLGIIASEHFEFYNFEKT